MSENFVKDLDRVQKTIRVFTRSAWPDVGMRYTHKTHGFTMYVCSLQIDNFFGPNPFPKVWVSETYGRGKYHEIGLEDFNREWEVIK